MSSLYLFQFAALVFMLVNALFVALARLNARWKNKRYERSRLMIFLALVLLSAQYYVQMRFHIRATDDHLGAMVNMLVYTPCFGLIAMVIYNLEAVQAKRRNMALACAGFYAAIVGCFALGHYLRGSWHIGGWLYPMLALYSVHMIYCVLMIRKETHKRRRMLGPSPPPTSCPMYAIRTRVWSTSALRPLSRPWPSFPPPRSISLAPWY